MATADREDTLVHLIEAALHLSRRLESRPFTNPDIAHITPIERLVLQYIERHPGTSLRRLAEEVKLQPSNASAAVKELVRKGHVARSRDAIDRRQITLDLTPTARDNIALVHAEWRNVLAGAGVEPADLETALAVLTRLGSCLGRTR